MVRIRTCVAGADHRPVRTIRSLASGDRVPRDREHGGGHHAEPHGSRGRLNNDQRCAVPADRPAHPSTIPKLGLTGRCPSGATTSVTAAARVARAATGSRHQIWNMWVVLLGAWLAWMKPTPAEVEPLSTARSRP